MSYELYNCPRWSGFLASLPSLGKTKGLTPAQSEFITQGLNPKTRTAIDRLRRSERGRGVLRDFRRMVDNGAYGLDSENFAALLVLSQALVKGERDFVELLPEAVCAS